MCWGSAYLCGRVVYCALGWYTCVRVVYCALGGIPV